MSDCARRGRKKTFTKSQILSARGAYSEARVFELLGDRKSVTLADIISAPIPRKDVLCHLCRLASPRTARLFACDEVERAMMMTGWSDPRSVDAVRVARLYVDGLATDEQLDAVWAAARAAAWAAVAWEERAAAWAAVSAVGSVSAVSMVSAVARAARAARGAVNAVAREAAWDTEIERQIAALVKMIGEEAK